MERNAWKYNEYECSVCGLPFRSAGQDSWIVDQRETPLPPEFDNEDAIAKLANNELWLDQAILLCDPDDEMGQLVPSFAYENLRNYAVQHLECHPSSLPSLPTLKRSSGIEEYKAEHMGGPCFYLCRSDGRKDEVNVHHWDFPTFDGRAYIPIHAACLDMAKRVIKSSSCKYLSSMHSVFLALRWRHAVSQMFGETHQEANYMVAPAFWYRPYGNFWEFGDYPQEETGKAQWPGPTLESEFNLLYVSWVPLPRWEVT